MISRRSTLVKPDAQFIALANMIYEQCSEHAVEWTVDTHRLETCATLLAAANAAYEANSDRATCNAVTANTKKAAFVELKRFLANFIGYLEVNMSVPNAALVAMGLRSRERHGRQPLPRPAEAPQISVQRRHGEMVVHAARPLHGHSAHGSLTGHYHGFIVRYKKEGDTDFHIAASTRKQHTLYFEQADEGKRIWLSAAWLNPRLETGPWCEDITEIIG